MKYYKLYIVLGNIVMLNVVSFWYFITYHTKVTYNDPFYYAFIVICVLVMLVGGYLVDMGMTYRKHILENSKNQKSHKPK